MFKRIGAALLGLLALLAVFLLASRFWPASPLQKQARAALEQPQDWPGDNAWALLETLDHAGLDMAQRQALVDDRVRRFTAWRQENAGMWDDQAENQGRGPVPSLGGQAVAYERSELLCASNQALQCLDKVRQAPEAVAAELATRQPRLQQLAQLADYGHVRSPYPGDASMPFLHTLGGLFDPLAAHALAHVQGNSDQALDGLCRDIGAGRMLLTRSDSLINAMVGTAMLQANGQLLGQVLAELPAGQPLPVTCTTTLAPLPAQDLGLCRAMRSDYAMSRASISDSYQHQAASTLGASWMFNVDKTLNRFAMTQGQGCLTPIQQELAADLPATFDEGELSLWRMECPANAIGCILSAVAGPVYTDYVRRAQDAAAQQRLLGALVWLREQPALTPDMIAQRLQDLPVGLQSPSRPVQLSADGRSLEVAQRYARNSPAGTGPISLPLPRAWWPPATAGSSASP